MSEYKTEEHYKTVNRAANVVIAAGVVGAAYCTKVMYGTGKEILDNEIANADLEKISSPTNNVNFYADKMSVGMTTTPADILDSTDSII